MFQNSYESDYIWVYVPEFLEHFPDILLYTRCAGGSTSSHSMLPSTDEELTVAGWGAGPGRWS